MLRLQDHLFIIKIHFDSPTFHKVAGNLFSCPISLNIQINGTGTERNNVFFQCLHFQLWFPLFISTKRDKVDFLKNANLPALRMEVLMFPSS